MAHYYIGVDGGGSKTRYLCVDADGRVCGHGLTLGTYCAQDGIDTVIDRLKDGIAQCLPADAEDILVGFGMPAYGEDKALDAIAVERICAALAPVRIHFENDSAIGWAGALAMSPGISVVGGTGSIAYGRDSHGRVERSGGWHEFFSDEGSGYWLGKRLLQLFSQQSDGRREKTLLYDLVRERLSLKDDYDIAAMVSQQCVSSRKNTAALQTILLEAARAGDPCALESYDMAAQELCSLVLAVRNRLDFPPGEPVTVSFQGGLFSIRDLIKDAVAEKVLAAAPGNIQFCDPRLEPCRGAILLAMETAEPENLEKMRFVFCHQETVSN